ncbi:MAG TPA: sigma-70 family RNA polymerase sigma factor [Herbaspirillum sp.]|jgi:RNA polymerase sigma-70 factor (ECF subfamily)
MEMTIAGSAAQMTKSSAARMAAAVRPVASAFDGVVLRDCLAANYTRLHHRLLRHLGCPDQASDCLHDAWLKLGGMTVSAVVSSPEAYIYRVACNIAIDRLRSDRSLQYADDIDNLLETIADCSPGPEVIVEVRSDVAAMDRALQRLPRRHQHILLDLKLEERTRGDVAVDNDLSLRNVDTILRQALDYCAEQTGRLVEPGSRPSRRRLPLARLGA